MNTIRSTHKGIKQWICNIITVVCVTLLLVFTLQSILLISLILLSEWLQYHLCTVNTVLVMRTLSMTDLLCQKIIKTNKIGLDIQIR